MSQLESFYERITIAVNLFNNFQAVPNNEELQKEFLKKEENQSLFSHIPENLKLIVNKLKNSNASEEIFILDEFKTLNQLERKCLILIMEFIVKLGIINNSIDLDKRKHWYEMLCHNNIQ